MKNKLQIRIKWTGPRGIKAARSIWFILAIGSQASWADRGAQLDQRDKLGQAAQLTQEAQLAQGSHFAQTVQIAQGVETRQIQAEGPTNGTSIGEPVRKRSKSKMTYNFIEYNRGLSSPVITDINVAWNNRNLTYKNVVLQDRSFEPDTTPLPLAWIGELAKGKPGEAISNLTTPYYGLRYYRFLKSHPQVAWGIDLTHFKIYMQDMDQVVARKGSINGIAVDDRRRLGEDFKTFNISHGVNHIGFSVTYRLMEMADAQIPDGRLQPYVSLSLGPVIPHTQLTLREPGQVSKKIDNYKFGFPNIGFDFSLGVRYKIFNSFGIYLAYKYSYTYLHGISFDNEEGELNLDWWTNHLLWGVSVAF